MRKYIFTIGMIVGFFAIVHSQTITDALRYSSLEFGATGRAIGTGSSFGVLGADYSLMGSNPAGLAAFRKSEFTFTGGLENAITDSQLQNGESNLLEEARSNFTVHNLGLVFSGKPVGSKWKTVNFGMGVNRIANFNQEFYFNGFSQGSISDRWLENATGYFPDELPNVDPFETDLAYLGSVIYQTANNSGTDTYFTDYQGTGVALEKSQTVRTKGGITEFNLAFAGNYSEKLYIGGSLNIPFVRFEEEKRYTETDEADEIPAFDQLLYNEYLSTTGAGINLKLGFIYRVTQMIRVGASVHTPTRYGLEDSYRSELEYDFTDPNVSPFGLQESPDGLFEYSLVTPWRLNGGAGFIIGKRGFISGEVEWVDYSNMRFDFDNGTEDDLSYARELNNEIQNTYQSAVNVKVGGELVFDIFRLRAGVGLNGSPYLNDNTNQMVYSGGFGIREKWFFLDLAYQTRSGDENYFPYQVAAGPGQVVSTNWRRSLFALTIGFKI
ncbi:MAG: hypothetical protein KDC24_08920 [Saprospiraceae bacterium]|nr:hypothetical protein [Saprospiraceae bacterium]